MHIRPFRALLPNLEYITSTDSFFESVKEDFPEYLQSGLFREAPQEALYVYRIRGPQRSFTGLIACCDIGDYLDGSIKKHEQTLADKEQQQMDLLLRRRAAVKPVLLTYPVVEAITRWCNDFAENRPPELHTYFSQDGKEHLLWAVTATDAIAEVQALFADRAPMAVIADGHHRAAGMARLFQRSPREERDTYADLLCAFFPGSELVIHDFNRVVEAPPDLTLTRFMARISQLFDIRLSDHPQRPAHKHDLLLFVNHEWYHLRWRKEVLDAYAAEEVILDSHLLNELVLRDILGIEDVRVDQGVDYVEGPKGLEGFWEQARKKELSIGFCLYPVQVEELFILAGHNRMLPPKSTWFEPRMKNGLIVQPLGEGFGI